MSYNTHTKRMLLRLLFALTFFALSFSAQAATREYFVAAEDVIWDYAPSGKNLMQCLGGACPIPVPWDKSHVFNKVRYIEYTDGGFTTKKPQPAWLGVLGPIIRAEVGDVVLIHFCNKSTYGYLSMHPHGFRYDKNSEGAHYAGVDGGQAPGTGSRVAPGHCFDYMWVADDDSGPGPGEVSSKVWWYHSHIHEPVETNLGLLGPLIITRQGEAKADGSPNDVDMEFVTSFQVFDEDGGKERGLMHSINGYIFGNLRGLVMHYGQRVRWHVLAMGNEVDLHTPHWHGKTVSVGAPAIARRTDVLELLPASMITVDMNADNVGEWMYHCHVADHIDAGMMTSYQILP